MRLVPPEPIIEIGVDGFAGRDLLGRADLGRKLSALVDNIEGTAVVALDGQWGAGKTSF